MNTIDEILWWGYLHAAGSIQLKRWFGDVKDYTTDCEGNDFVVYVVPPFPAHNREQALRIIQEKLREANERHGTT
jgi:hypothetical protein